MHECVKSCRSSRRARSDGCTRMKWMGESRLKGEIRWNPVDSSNAYRIRVSANTPYNHPSPAYHTTDALHIPGRSGAKRPIKHSIRLPTLTSPTLHTGSLHVSALCHSSLFSLLLCYPFHLAFGDFFSLHCSKPFAVSSLYDVTSTSTHVSFEHHV